MLSSFYFSSLSAYLEPSNHWFIMNSSAGKGGGQGGQLPPNVEKDGPSNSSKFDEKIGRGYLSISDVKKS